MCDQNQGAGSLEEHSAQPVGEAIQQFLLMDFVTQLLLSDHRLMNKPDERPSSKSVPAYRQAQ